MNKTKQLSKVEIIKFIADYYTSKNRCVDNQGNCSLCLDNKKSALGLCMLPVKIEKALDYVFCPSAQDIDKLFGGIDNALKKQYRGHEVKFWRNLEIFHDVGKFWDEDGLTDEGFREKQWLINKFSL